MLRTLLVTLVFPVLAAADVDERGCASFLTPSSYLDQDAERAWTAFRSGLARRSPTDARYAWLEHLRQWRRDEVINRRGRALVARPVTERERAILCDALTPLLLESSLAVHDPDLAFYLLDQLCASAPSELLAVTESVVRRAPTAARWFELLGRARRPGHGSALAPDDWRELLRRRPSPALLAYVRRSWRDLGLVQDDLTAVARRMIRAGRPVESTIAATGLTLAQLPELKADLDQVQWIEFRHRFGRLDRAALTAAAAITVHNGVSLEHVHQVLARALYDERVPYDVFTDLAALAERYWRHTYPDPMPRLPYRPPWMASGAQVARAERYFGTWTVRPQKVFEDSRRYAETLADSLALADYASVDEFIRGYELRRNIPAPRPGANGRFTPVDLERTRALADVYFWRVRRELPGLLALNPGVEEVRHLLEMPGQFAPAAVGREIDPRAAWRRATVLRPGTFDTGRVIASIQAELLAWAMPRVRTLGEWEHLLSARELSHLLDLAPYVAVAARVGPGNLSWLDHPLVRKLGENLAALDELRASEPPVRRDDDHLTARAAERLVYDDLDDGRRHALLTYLSARAEAGVFVHLDPAELSRLRAVAFAGGFAVDEFARDRASVAITLRPRPAR